MSQYVFVKVRVHASVCVSARVLKHALTYTGSFCVRVCMCMRVRVCLNVYVYVCE